MPSKTFVMLFKKLPDHFKKEAGMLNKKIMHWETFLRINIHGVKVLAHIYFYNSYIVNNK